MKKRGRKSVYDTKIKPKFDFIKSSLEKGATEKQVAEHLGIAYSTWNKYKIEKKEFTELLKSIDRSELVEDLRGSLIKKALGFHYKEKKTTVQHIESDDGDILVPAKIVKEEISEKYSPPDVAAINLALKNYDKENWSNDWQAYDIKKQELEIKKQQAEKDNW